MSKAAKPKAANHKGAFDKAANPGIHPRRHGTDKWECKACGFLPAPPSPAYIAVHTLSGKCPSCMRIDSASCRAWGRCTPRVQTLWNDYCREVSASVALNDWLLYNTDLADYNAAVLCATNQRAKSTAIRRAARYLRRNLPVWKVAARLSGAGGVE